jgi:hypothetical protein
MRVNGSVLSQATVVAVGVTSEGERQVIGIDVGPSEDRAFWTAFPRSLVKRGLRGVRRVTSYAPKGLTQAIATVLNGPTWQPWRIDFMRNLLATVPKGAREAIAALPSVLLLNDLANERSQMASASRQHFRVVLLRLERTHGKMRDGRSRCLSRLAYQPRRPQTPTAQVIGNHAQRDPGCRSLAEKAFLELLTRRTHYFEPFGITRNSGN